MGVLALISPMLRDQGLIPRGGPGCPCSGRPSGTQGPLSNFSCQLGVCVPVARRVRPEHPALAGRQVRCRAKRPGSGSCLQAGRTRTRLRTQWGGDSRSPAASPGRAGSVAANSAPAWNPRSTRRPACRALGRPEPRAPWSVGGATWRRLSAANLGGPAAPRQPGLGAKDDLAPRPGVVVARRQVTQWRQGWGGPWWLCAPGNEVRLIVGR